MNCLIAALFVLGFALIIASAAIEPPRKGD